MIDFDSPAFITNDTCSGSTCPDFYVGAHHHCATDGKTLWAEGGGGDDGSHIGGFTDAVECTDCREMVCDKFPCYVTVNGKDYCADCAAANLAKAEDDDLAWTALQEAVDGVKLSVKRLRQQQTPERMTQIATTYGELVREMKDYKPHLQAAIARAHDTPLPLLVAV